MLLLKFLNLLIILPCFEQQLLFVVRQSHDRFTVHNKTCDFFGGASVGEQCLCKEGMTTMSSRMGGGPAKCYGMVQTGCTLDFSRNLVDDSDLTTTLTRCSSCNKLFGVHLWNAKVNQDGSYTGEWIDISLRANERISYRKPRLDLSNLFGNRWNGQLIKLTFNGNSCGYIKKNGNTQYPFESQFVDFLFATQPTTIATSHKPTTKAFSTITTQKLTTLTTKKSTSVTSQKSTTSTTTTSTKTTLLKSTTSKSTPTTKIITELKTTYQPESTSPCITKTSPPYVAASTTCKDSIPEWIIVFILLLVLIVIILSILVCWLSKGRTFNEVVNYILCDKDAPEPQRPPSTKLNKKRNSNFSLKKLNSFKSPTKEDEIYILPQPGSTEPQTLQENYYAVYAASNPNSTTDDEYCQPIHTPKAKDDRYAYPMKNKANTSIKYAVPEIENPDYAVLEKPSSAPKDNDYAILEKASPSETMYTALGAFQENYYG